MTSLRFALQLLCFTCLLISCSSLQHVEEDYRDHLTENSPTLSQRTVLFILVDGLPLSTVKTQLSKGALPEIQKHFLSNNRPLYQARTPFPSLTYPGIGSLLTEKSVDQNGIFGNTIVMNGGPLNFEVPSSYAKLNQLISGKTIFSRLKAKGLSSVSFDFSFLNDASAHTRPTDSNVGLGILSEEYNIPDRRQLKGLQNLLEKTNPQAWPDFIFIHLLGVDFNTHDHGPDSPQTIRYLRKLDEQLGPVFEILRAEESKKSRQIVTMLSADHGFDELIDQRIDLETAVRKQDRNIFVINEGRFAGIYFPQTYSEKQRAQFLLSWSEREDIEIVATREDDHVFIRSKKLEIAFQYLSKPCKESNFGISIGAQTSICPEDLSTENNSLFYPYFLSNLSFYFRATAHPDALIIPRPGVTFKEKILGQHGGPTPREIFVPLFIRGASLGDTQKIPALWELLRFL